MPLDLTPLPTDREDGDDGHTDGHNATNTAVNTIAEYVDALELGAGAVTSVNGRTGAVTGLAETSDLTAHEADTTSVHGIADTSVLATSSTVASAITTHTAATDPHGDRAFATSAIATHEADTTSVHGIADTAALATTAAVAAGYQPLDSDLTAIAALAPTNDDVVQRKAGAWTNRTMAQVKTDLALTKSDVGLGNVTNNAQVTGVTAGDATITIAGTSAAPTVAVATIAESQVTNLVTDLAAKQPLDSDLTTIAGLTATTDNFLQSKASAWASRTPAQVAADLVSPLSSSLQPIDSDLTTIAGLTATTDNFLQAKASAWASRTPTQVAADLVTPLSSSLQPLDSDLTAIAALTPTNDDIIQRKAGAWTNRTVAQVKTDLGLATVATSGSASDITTGTLADAQIASTIARDTEVTAAVAAHAALANPHPQYLDGWSAGAGGNVETVPRLSLGEVALTSGELWVGYFTAQAATVVANLGKSSAAAAAATITLIRMGLFTVAGDDAVTLVARTANTSSLGNGGFSNNVAVLATTGGYPATYTLTPGTRYALGFLAVATDAGSGRIAGLTNEGMAPVLSRKVAGQTDILTSYSAATLGGAHYQALYIYATP